MFINPVRFVDTPLPRCKNLDTQHQRVSLGYILNMTRPHMEKVCGAIFLIVKQLRSKKNFGNSNPTSSPTERRLNLGDEIPIRWVDCNIPDFYGNQKYELFKIFPVIV